MTSKHPEAHDNGAVGDVRVAVTFPPDDKIGNTESGITSPVRWSQKCPKCGSDRYKRAKWGSDSRVIGCSDCPNGTPQ